MTTILDTFAMEAVDTCPLCRRPNPGTPILDRFDIPTGISGCPACLITYLNPRLSPAGAADFYAGPYRTAIQSADPAYTPAAMHAGQRMRGQRLSAWLAMQRLVAQDCAWTTLVDVGGSSGEFAAAMGTDPSQITVVDVAGKELAHAASLGLQTIAIPAEAWIPTQSYDLALCVQTLDHLTDPIAVLTRLRGCAQWLYVDIVDFPTQCAVYGRLWVKVDHPINWCPTALDRVLARTQWRAVATQVDRQGHYGVLCTRQE